MSKIVVIGSSNTDMVVRTDHIPVPGETILGGAFFMNSGGKGANQAVAVARLGGDVTFIAKVGNDVFGKQNMEGLRKEGINTEYVTVHPSAHSGVALIAIGRNGENSIVVASGANDTLDKEDIDKAVDQIREAKIILVQLEISMKTISYVLELAAKYGKRVILNPAPALELPDSFYRSLYAITPNETEAEILTGIKVTDEQSAKDAATVLRQKGVNVVIITMGKKGAYVLTEQDHQLIPAREVVARDTTAAGDTFNGALAVCISNGMLLEEAVKFANRAAAVTVTRPGAQSAIPYLSDLD